MPNKRRMLVCVLTLLAVVPPAAQVGLAGKWTGAEQGRGNVTFPVTLELVVNGEEATGTVSIGDDPVKTLASGKVQGTTVTFATPAMMNGCEITITSRGELKEDPTFHVGVDGMGDQSPRCGRSTLRQ